MQGTPIGVGDGASIRVVPGMPSSTIRGTPTVPKQPASRSQRFGPGLWVAGLVGVLVGCAVPDRSGESLEGPTSPYVGDAACATCHEDIYQSWHRTGMGRSFSRFDAASAPESLPGGPVYHPPSDFHYEAFARGDTLFQREYRIGDRGETVHERIHAVEWVVGSGNHTRSYLMSVNGHLSEMPLTWYANRRIWDMSPSYRQENLRFDRPIVPECMTCHNGFAEHTSFTMDHYERVPEGITCERCHGPGGDHVERRLVGLGGGPGEPDTTIVHPARLSRDLQMSVCQQCHLSGTTVFRPGETPFTYRPGTSIEAHRSVFVPEEQLDDPERFGIASHAIRLEKSACFQRSEMTCTTCHDPHVANAELGSDYFNEACKGCHAPGEFPLGNMGGACSREGVHVLDDATTGDCTACHLRASGTSDIPHVTFTDHWIRRTVPPASYSDEMEHVFVRPDPMRLVRVGGMPEGTHPGYALIEEAIAYFAFYEDRHELGFYLDSVVTKAQTGLQAGADHPDGRLALARALLEEGRSQEAVAVLSEAVLDYPDHARMRYWQGVAFLNEGLPGEAIAALRHAVELQPVFVEARVKLGEALQATGRVGEAESAYLAALAEDPVRHPGAWNNLGMLYMGMGRLGEARTMFERALGLAPDLAPALVNAAALHMSRSEWEQAAGLLRRAVERAPDFVPGLGNLAVVQWQLGRPDEAVRTLDALLRLHPEDQRARSLLEEIEQERHAGD